MEQVVVVTHEARKPQVVTERAPMHPQRLQELAELAGGQRVGQDGLEQLDHEVRPVPD